MNETVSLHDFFALFGSSIAASAVAAALCGYLGFFVVSRRIAFVSAALGQISGLGVALGFWAGTFFGVDPHQHMPVWLDPVVMALILTGLVSAAMSSVNRIQRTTSESAVAFAYLTAGALALLVLASPRVVNEAHEVNDLLFGNTVAVRSEHLVELIGVALLVLVSHVFLYKDLLFVSFDREMAKTLKLPVTLLDLILLVSVGISVAVATRAVGALPVFGFLVLPAGAALLVVESVPGVIALSMVGALLAAGAGFYWSFIASLPTGPMMVMCCALFWPLAGAVRLVSKRRA